MGDNPMPVSLNDDSEAISKDWKNVGMDILTALNKYGKQNS